MSRLGVCQNGRGFHYGYLGTTQKFRNTLLRIGLLVVRRISQFGHTSCECHVVPVDARFHDSEELNWANGQGE